MTALVFLLSLTSLGAAQMAASDPAGAEPVVTVPSTVAEPIVIERIIAVVNQDIVLLSEIEGILEALAVAEPPPPGTDLDKWRTSRRTDVLDTLIAEKLLDQEIKKLRIDVTDAEIDRVIEGTMAQHNLDRPRLEAALEAQGLSFQEYRDGLKKQILKGKIIQLKVKSRVVINDQDVKSVYAKQKRTSAKEFRLRARHMIFLVPPGSDDEPAKKAALAAKKRVDAGEEFSDIAREVSDGPSRSNGGALGEFGRGEMMVEFEEAAFKATPGRVTEPVRTPIGWHLILVDERVALEERPLEAVEENLRNQLYENEVENAFRRYIDELKQKAYIEVRS
jgi:peptidyl-prolyl cis-trans isomerase SurA